MASPRSKTPTCQMVPPLIRDATTKAPPTTMIHKAAPTSESSSPEYLVVGSTPSVATTYQTMPTYQMMPPLIRDAQTKAPPTTMIHEAPTSTSKPWWTKELAAGNTPSVPAPHDHRPPLNYQHPGGWPAQTNDARTDTPSPLVLAAKTKDEGERQLLLDVAPPVPPNSVSSEPLVPLPPSNYPRHIIMPFNLRNEPDAIRDVENRNKLLDLFPGANGLSTDGGFLHILFHQNEKMPEKPWPKTVAGLPVYFAWDGKGGPTQTPRTLGRCVSFKNPRIATHIEGRWMKEWQSLFKAIKIYFEAIQTPITEVMYWGEYLTIVLEHRDADTKRLPSRAGNIPCMYRYDDEMGRSSTQVQAEVSDTSERGTSAGLLVRDAAGKEVTVTAMGGVPSDHGSNVNRRLPMTNRLVGTAVTDSSKPGISLAKLPEDEDFFHVTLQGDDTTESVQLKRFITAKDFKIGGTVFFDSPDGGLMEGVFRGTSYRRATLPKDGTMVEKWVLAAWHYMGQGSAGSISRGARKSAMWNLDGGVVGFVWYAPAQGVMADWCCGVAPDNMVRDGYSVVDTSERETGIADEWELVEADDRGFGELGFAGDSGTGFWDWV